MTVPNLGSVTKWGGMIDICIWIGTDEQALRQYNEPADCVENDDGTSFKDHMLNDEHYLCAHHMAAALHHVQQLIATLEGGLYPTSILVKPYVGKMIDRLEPGRTTTTTYRDKREIIKIFVFIYSYDNSSLIIFDFYLLYVRSTIITLRSRSSEAY